MVFHLLLWAARHLTATVDVDLASVVLAAPHHCLGFPLDGLALGKLTSKLLPLWMMFAGVTANVY